MYRATDTNLGRQVAIKVLPDTFLHDPERLARFEREARTLASLNHPNIASIYGLEKADGMRGLVMELVEGPTLAERIAQGPIAIEEALPIAKQIAEALEAAHEQGIIHRDLKPANVKVRPDGTVKVLDFGLAKALEPAGATSPGVTQSPTITSPAMMTGVGVLLGTAAYMSPEQARGKAVDKRTDVWAFGAVLYEMLTGQASLPGRRGLGRPGIGAGARARLDAAACQTLACDRQLHQTVSPQGPEAAHSRHWRCLSRARWRVRGRSASRGTVGGGHTAGVAPGASGCRDCHRRDSPHWPCGVEPMASRRAAIDDAVRLCAPCWSAAPGDTAPGRGDLS